MMKRSAGSTLLFAFIAMVQVACMQPVSPLGTHSESENHSRSNFADKTEIQTTTIDVRQAMTSVSLDVQVTLSDGAATLRLMDPSGTVQGEEHIAAPASYTKSASFTPVVGEWALEVSLENATGGYDILLRGSN